MKHNLESLLEQIGVSSFLSFARIITFSPPRTLSKPPCLEAFLFPLYGGGPPLNLLYTIFHDFVYLLLTNDTPFTYLA